MSKDPLMSYIRSQLHSKRSVIRTSGTTPDLGSFGSQGSVHFGDLEILRPCGEGSFGKVR